MYRDALRSGGNAGDLKNRTFERRAMMRPGAACQRAIDIEKNKGSDQLLE
jgi:hypothetical protein